MMKAMRALTRYAAAGIEDTGLGLSDFGVLEALLHKGPLPVNTIGPIVDLTPGSISIAVDRLFAKGLVTRVESTEDRRVHGELVNCAKIRCFSGFDSMPGCVISSSFLFI
jgi:MarR family 2-MHQ and catechol resistance regulon transcriptional repressor